MAVYMYVRSIMREQELRSAARCIAFLLLLILFPYRSLVCCQCKGTPLITTK